MTEEEYQDLERRLEAVEDCFSGLLDVLFSYLSVEDVNKKDVISDLERINKEFLKVKR